MTPRYNHLSIGVELHVLNNVRMVIESLYQLAIYIPESDNPILFPTQPSLVLGFATFNLTYAKVLFVNQL